MVVWNLEPGAEQAIPINRRRAVAKSPDLTPMELARRAQELGARVEFKNSRYRIYPPDRTKSPVWMADRFPAGRASRNAVAELQRAGLDVLAEPEKETPPVPTPAVKPAPKPGPSPTDGRVAELEQQSKDLFELVTSELEKVNARVAELEARLAATPGAPPAADPNAELDEAILSFMRATPIKLTAPVIAANLAVAEPISAEQVADRLDALATAGTVAASGDEPERLYLATADTAARRSA